MDEREAIFELRCLSKNAKEFLEDRIGNRLNQMVTDTTLGSLAKAEQARDALVADFQEIGCFEMQRLTTLGMRPARGTGKES